MNNLEQKILEGLLRESYELHIRNAGVYRFPASYEFREHSHREVEMIYVNSGHCVMGIGKSFVPLKQGDYISISGSIPHCFIVDTRKNCSITQLEFEMKMPESLKEGMPFLCQDRKYYKLVSGETVRFLMENICRIFRMPGDAEQRETQLLFGFLQLFLAVSQKLEKAKGEKEKNGKAGRVEHIIRYLSENYESDICMEDLAQRFGLSSRYIRKCFTREAGMSCQQYIATLRINKAKEFLWYTSDTVTEIAMKTGFNSSQYFSRVFQQYTEMTPMEYRNLWRGSKAQELCDISGEGVDEK